MERPRPVPPKAPGCRWIALGEGLEETLQVGRRDADAGVSHGKLQPGLAVLRRAANADFNLAVIRELDGIPGQVEQHLL